jgi:signal transduction histidine kinase
LTAALRDLTERMATSAGLEARFLADMHEVAPGYAQSTSAFRVAQEALTNVVRHAGGAR